MQRTWTYLWWTFLCDLWFQQQVAWHEKGREDGGGGGGDGVRWYYDGLLLVGRHGHALGRSTTTIGPSREREVRLLSASCVHVTPDIDFSLDRTNINKLFNIDPVLCTLVRSDVKKVQATQKNWMIGLSAVFLASRRNSKMKSKEVDFVASTLLLTYWDKDKH